MSTKHVRATDGARVVMVLSDHHHREGHNKGRKCQFCGALWTVKIDANKDFHVWRNKVQVDSEILDWDGNNVAVQCCASNLT